MSSIKTWELTEEQKKVAEKVKAISVNENPKLLNDFQTSIKTNADTVNKLTAKGKSGYLSNAERVQLRKATYNLEKGLLNLKTFGYDTENSLKNIGDLHKSTDIFSEIYGKYENEEAYKEALETQNKKDAMLVYDRETGLIEIENLKTQISNLQAAEQRILDKLAKYHAGDRTFYKTQEERDRADLNLQKREKEIAWLFDELNKKQVYHDEAIQFQEDKKRAENVAKVTTEAVERFEVEARNDPEYEKYATAGDKLENRKDFVFSTFGIEKTIPNKVTYAIANKENLQKAVNSGVIGNESELYLLSFMTKDEVKVHNYYLTKRGEVGASLYLEKLEPILKERAGGEYYKDTLEGKRVKEMLYGITAGIDNFVHDITNLFPDDDYISPSVTQYANSLAYEDLEGFGFKFLGKSSGQWTNAALSNISYQAPSILSGMVANAIVPGSGVFVQSGLMGASALSGAYQQKINEGYGKTQARNYATLVGISETCLSTLLSGIGYEGLLNKKFTKLIDGVDSALGKFVLLTTKDILLEVTEEDLQAILEQTFANLVFDENKPVVDMEVIADTTVLTTLTTFFMGGGKNAINALSLKTQQSTKQSAQLSEVNGINAITDATLKSFKDSDISRDSGYEAIGDLVKNSQSLDLNDIKDFAKQSDDKNMQLVASGENMTDNKVGRLYSFMFESIKGEFNADTNIKSVNKQFKEISAKYKGNETASAMVKSVYLNRLIELNLTKQKNSIKKQPKSKNTPVNTPAPTVFTEPDVSENTDPIGAMVGEETEGQREIKTIAKNLGRRVVFENTKAVQGFASQGYIDKNGVIHIDMSNKTPLKFVFKHELTHYLEALKNYKQFTKTVRKTKLYREWLIEKTGKDKDTSTAVLETAYRKMIEDSRRPVFESAIKELEQQRSEATTTEEQNILGYKIEKLKNEIEKLKSATFRDKEMIADFVGDKLFTDDMSTLQSLKADLSQKEYPAFIQAILDFFSWLKKKLGGQKQLTQEISKLEDAYNRLLSERTKNADTKVDGNKNSIVMLDNGNVYVSASRKVITGKTIPQMRSQITEFFNMLLDGNESLHIPTVEGDILTITKTETANKARDNYKYENGQSVKMSPDEFRVKLNAEAHIDELAEVSRTNNSSLGTDTKNHEFAKDGFEYRTAYFEDFDGEYYKITLSVGHNGTVATVYNVGKIKKDNLPSATKIVAGVGSRPLGKLSNDIIAQKEPTVNTHSMQTEENNSSDYGNSFSIANNVETTEGKTFDKVVEVNVDIFKGLKQRKWKTALIPFVKNHLAGKQIEVYDDLGNSKTIEFAKTNERVRKDDAKNERKVIDKLQQKNDRNSQIAVANAVELVEISLYDSENLEHSHQWLDENGWEFRKSYMMFPNGEIYEVTLNIGKTKDGRNVLYDINEIHQVAVGKNLANENSQDVETTTLVNEYSIPNSTDNVNSFSISDENNSTEVAKNRDFTKEHEEIFNRFQNGEIDADEYRTQVATLIEEAGQEYGTIEQGEKVSDDNNFDNPLPTSVRGGNSRVSRFVRTIMETGYADEQMSNILMKQVLSDDLSYEVQGNEATINKAKTRVENGTAYDKFKSAVHGKATAVDVATGEMLLRLALEEKDAKSVVEFTADLCDMGTRLGQDLQAFRLLKRMGGVGKLMYVIRFVSNMNKDLQKRYKNQPEIVINEELAQELGRAETQEDIEITYIALMEDIADQIPSTFLDKWNAWRYMAMLFNPTTHVRNMFGNAIFIPALRIKDTIATVLESAAVKSNRIKFTDQDKTKSVTIKKEYRDFAEKDFEFVKDIITGDGKMNPNDYVKDGRHVFNNRVLETLRKFNFDKLEQEDVKFLKMHYTKALAGFLQARGVDLSTLNKSEVNAANDVLINARNYAIVEAQKATYRDFSAVANALSSFSNLNAGTNILMEGILPFKKTPINIVKRGIEYSPVGLLKTLSYGIYQVKTNKISIAQFIDGLASGLTGTGIYLVGMLLSSLRVVTSGFGDDDEWFRKLNGEQEYSIKIGDMSYTIDWAAPAMIPFFMGVTIQELFAEENADESDILSKISSSLLSGLEPIIELSMLSGIQDAIDSARYSDSNKIMTDVVSHIVSSYFSQALPTIGGKLGNLVDDKQRLNYIDKNSNVPEFVQVLFNKVSSKIPGLSNLKPERINAWGETEDRGNIVERFFESFVSPGYYSEVEANEITEELQRLYDMTNDTGVLPDSAKQKFKFRGYTKNLTPEEYNTYATTRGQASADYVSEVINATEYKKLDDEQRAKVIKNLYDFANAKAKCKLDYSYEEVSVMYEGEISSTDWNGLSTKAKKIVLEDYFFTGSITALKKERNGGSVVDYYINKELEDAKKKNNKK